MLPYKSGPESGPWTGLSFSSKGTYAKKIKGPLLERVNGVKGTKDHFFLKSEIAKFKKFKRSRSMLATLHKKLKVRK